VLPARALLETLLTLARLKLVSIILCYCICVGSVEAACTHPIYCTGPVLEAIELAAVFNDSKTFVDLPMRQSVDDVLAAFNALPDNSFDTLTDFVNTYFYPVNSDLIPVVPTDWQKNPDLFNYIKDPLVKEFAGIVNSKWLDLVRQFNNSFCDGCFSHIAVPNPFVISGSRFREFYYWDTYWSIDGLLLSGMSQTALGVIQDFLGLVSTLGFVPNGGRIYYLDRSQPPMLIQMVKLYYAYEQDKVFLQEALPILEQEYNYWMNNHSVVLDANATLNRYYVINSAPRPESFLEDYTTVSGLSDAAKANVYQQLASTAESGWDFSTRWMSNPPDLTSLITTELIPVDLNCILYANELALATLYEELQNEAKGEFYRTAAANRLNAIQKYLWDPVGLMWRDYDTTTQQLRSGYYAYQFVPFWSGVYQVLTHDQISAVVQNLLPVFDYIGGIPTSLNNSGQQWDFPNGWAPLQFWAIEGFRALNSNPNWQDPVLSRQLTNVSNSLIQRWITTNYCAYKTFNQIFEKFDVTVVGSWGSGGEYTVQDGFGWTNGVALRFIAEHADTLVMGSCGGPEPISSGNNVVVSWAMIGFIAAVILCL